MVMKSSTVQRSRFRLSTLSFSRHSVLNTGTVSAFRELRTPTHNFGTIVASLLIGCALIGIAVNMMVVAELGLAPYDVFSSGISNMTGLSLGQAGWLVAAVLFATAALLGQRPTLWGAAYVLANGIAIDLTAGLINAPTSYAGRVVLITAAVVVMAFGINFVLHAGVTGGAFELLMRAGAERGIDPIKIRYGLDIGILLAGIAIGGTLGIATVIYAATMGLVFAQMRIVLEDHRAGRSARLQPSAEEAAVLVGASR